MHVIERVGLDGLRKVASSIGQGVMLLAPDHTIYWVNSAVLSLHAVSSQRDLGETVDDYYTRFQIRFSRGAGGDGEEANAGSSARETLAEITLPSDAAVRRTLRLCKLVLHDADGAVCGFALVFSEVDAEPSRLAPWQGVIPPAAALDLLCGVTPAPVHVLNAQGVIVRVSRAWLTWLGYADEEVLGRSITDFQMPGTADLFGAHFLDQLCTSGYAADATCGFRARSGELVSAQVEGRVVDAAAADPLFVCVSTDLTAAIRAEGALHAVVSLSPLPMLVRKAQDGRILAANEALLRLVGRAEADIVGHVFGELVSFDLPGNGRRFEAELRGGQTPDPVDVHVGTAAGHAVECRLYATPTHVFGHACNVIALHDVSERRRDERQLLQAIESVMQDSSWFSRTVVEKLAEVRTPPAVSGRPADLDDLTKREREVLAMISHGWSDADIAQRLGLTRSTVRNHVAAVYGKIEVHTRSGAIVWARDRALNVLFPASKFTPRNGVAKHADAR